MNPVEQRLAALASEAEASGDLDTAVRALEDLKSYRAQSQSKALARNQGFGNETLGTIRIGAGRAFDKIGAGIADLYYRATGNDKAVARLRKEQAENDAVFNPLSQAKPVSAIAGQALPYVAAPVVGSGLLGMAGTGAALGALGYEPTLSERVRNAAMGAVGGAVGYGAGRVAARLLGGPGTAVDDVTRARLESGKQLGFQSLPSQRSGSEGMARLEASMQAYPPTSRAVGRVKDANQAVANRIAAESVGARGLDRLTHEQLGKVADDISNTFDDLARRTTVNLDDQFIDDLAKIEARQVRTWVRDNDIASVLDNALSEAASGPIDGARYQQLSSQIGKSARQLLRGENSNPDKAFALFSLKEALDDAAERSMGPEIRAAFGQVRNQYRILMALEKPGVIKNAAGDISLPRLANTLRRMDKRGFTRGKNTSPLYEAARYGQMFGDVVGDSGTASRLSLPLGMQQSTIGGLIGAGIGAGAGAPVPGALIGAVAAPVAARLGAEAYMSPVVSGLLTRGLIPMSERVQGLVGREAGMLGASGLLAAQ